MNKKLSKEAYGGVSGKDYIPYVTSGSNLGGNLAVIIVGVFLAALFAASTAYSGMKAGLTVAAGIPGSILGSVLIAIFAKQKSILGKSLMQGMSSGGESIASGMIFVFPAVLLIGAQVTFFEGFVISVGGALLGVGSASLVYNYLIVQEHGSLTYPESMAISESLVASEGAKDPIKFMAIGFGIGGILTFLTNSFLNIANNLISYSNELIYKWRFQMEVNPLLLGIGFIVGLPTAVAMFSSSILANFAVTPLIGYFAGISGESATVWNNSSVQLINIHIGDIIGSYVRYIGAGIMLSGGLISAIRLIPVVFSSVKDTLRNRGAGGGGGLQEFIILFAGIVVGFVGGFLFSGGNTLMAVLSTIICIIMSMLFVIVAGRLTGTIGTSNLPVSGMTIASIVVVTLLFVGMGWVSGADNKTLLLFGTFIVTAIAVSGGYCQSQKVAFIIGADKNEMQKYYTIASIVGVVIVTGVILLFAGQLAMTGDNVPFALPQANLMATLTSGIMDGALPWVMIISGAVLGIVFFMLKLPVMTVAIGFYLPISTTSIILVGALVRVLVEKLSKNSERDIRISNGVSLSSGLVAGGSIIGLIGIIMQVTGIIGDLPPTGFANTNCMAFILLAVLVCTTTLFLVTGKVTNKE